MKEIDRGMKEIFQRDFSNYMGTISALEMNQVDIEIGIELCNNLIENIIADMFIIEQDAHDLFIEQRDAISLANKKAKEERKTRMCDPHDTLDSRNQLRLLLLYDLDKHKKLLKVTKSIAYTQGWLR